LPLPDAWAEYSLNYGNRETISTFDSGIIGLFFAYGSDRPEVLSLVRQMIFDFWMVGTVQTNQRFLFELLQHPWVQEEIFWAGFIDDEYIPNIYLPVEVEKFFLGVSTYLPEIVAENVEPETGEKSILPKWFVGKRRVKVDSASLTQARSNLIWSQGPIYWNQENRTAFTGVLQLPWEQLLGEKLLEGKLSSVESLNEQRAPIFVFPSGDHWLVRIGFWFSTLKRIQSGKSKQGVVLKAMNSGRIHAVLFLQGALVSPHDPLLTLEAFGVLVPHALPVEVRIGEWYVKAEDKVREGQELAHLIVV
jgi:acetyl/propionyl-CoA carboxylase alpha subunit